MDASDLPKTNAQTNQKPSPNEPTNATKGTTIARVHVPNEALKEKDCCLDAKSPAANECRNTKSPVQKNFRVSFLRKSKGRNKSKKKKGSQENAVGKNAKRNYFQQLPHRVRNALRK